MSKQKIHNEQATIDLFEAVKSGNQDAAIRAIEDGADVNCKDKYERTPLLTAAHRDHTEIALALIRAGADVNTQDGYGTLPLHIVASKGNTEIALALIRAGAKVNTKDSAGLTPLYFAACLGKTETALALIKAGADVNCKNNDGTTPLYLAARNGNTETLKLLTLNAFSDPSHVALMNLKINFHQQIRDITTLAIDTFDSRHGVLHQAKSVLLNFAFAHLMRSALPGVIQPFNENSRSFLDGLAKKCSFAEAYNMAKNAACLSKQSYPEGKNGKTSFANNHLTETGKLHTIRYLRSISAELALIDNNGNVTLQAASSSSRGK